MIFGGKSKALWKLHDDLRERGIPANECLVVDLSRLPGYFISEARGVPPKCLLVDVFPGEYLAIFVNDGFWEYMEMYSAGDEPMPSSTSTVRIGPVGKSIAHDVLALLEEKRRKS